MSALALQFSREFDAVDGYPLSSRRSSERGTSSLPRRARHAQFPALDEAIDAEVIDAEEAGRFMY